VTEKNCLNGFDFDVLGCEQCELRASIDGTESRDTDSSKKLSGKVRD
jgi:hypothetical protein